MGRSNSLRSSRSIADIWGSRANLNDVTAVANKAATQMATVAASLDKCNVPGRTGQESLPADQLEYGMGIHNEPGVKRENLSTLESVVERTLDTMFKPKPSMWHPESGNKVALMVNNLGGLSVLELGVIAEEVVQQLIARGICIARSLVGTFVTSLDGPGFSVTLLQLDDQLEELLDAPTTASAWPRSIHGVLTDSEAVSRRETQLSPLAAELDQATGHAGMCSPPERSKPRVLTDTKSRRLSSKVS
jgi:dihydroxyacetone kinase